MQNIFYTDRKISEYSKKDGSLFPEPPARCPHTGCQVFVRQKRHGFYERNIISAEFAGKIYIRRYICPVCGKTLSMLPVFCLPYYQYSLQIIFFILREYYCKLTSISGIVRKQHNVYPSLERRHIRLYKKRFADNRPLIEYGMNNISPVGNLARSQPEIYVWAKGTLDEMVKIPPSIFNQKFHQQTRKSFMARMKMIA